VTLIAVNAISDMVAPVVLLTVGGMLSNGLITIYNDIDNRIRDMTRERLEIRRGPAGQVLDADGVPDIDQERLTEIGTQLPMLLRRHKLTRLSVLTIYGALALLGLSIVVIAIAVGLNDEIAGRVALGLVLAGTIIMLLGLGVAAMSLAKSADAITYAVKRTTNLG
jgi:4-hydroxybenzoate polyprenyltransferase